MSCHNGQNSAKHRGAHYGVIVMLPSILCPPYTLASPDIRAESVLHSVVTVQHDSRCVIIITVGTLSCACDAVL